MVSAYLVPAEDLIQRIAQIFKDEKIINPPEWSFWVKTAHGKEDMPENPDWFYIRSASILRKIYMHGPIGVQQLRKIYGSKKNRGSKPWKASRASGAIIRNILQQLEQNGFLETDDNQGRKITSKGISFVDKISREIKETIPELKQYT